MKRKIIIALIIIALSAISVYIIISNKSEEKFEYTEKIEINVGDKIPQLSDYVDEKYISKTNNKIKWKDLKNEGDRVYHPTGYTGYFEYKKERKDVELIVIDNEAPTINNVKDITIYVNDKVDLKKDIEVKDNSDCEITLEITGDYDISKKGTYKLKYVATDGVDNKTEKDFTLTVKEKSVPKPTTNNKENNNVNKSSLEGTTSKGYKIEKKDGIYYINNILIANKTYGLPSSYAPGGLLSIFNDNFNKMKNDAQNEDISLNVISGYRSYSRQKAIYNNYVSKDGKAKADTYSARPGNSEHQTGLAADINSLYQSFSNTKEGEWLNNNCYKYGFIIRYPKGKESITGYIYEPWHIRYVGIDLATELYNNGDWITLEEYFGITSEYND